MARTLADIRRRDRDRKRTYRAHIRDAGIPTASQVNAAIAEAAAFVAASGVNIETAKAGGQPVIEMRQVLSAAHKILVQRMGLDAGQCTSALLRALAPRPEHRWPSHVPSHYAGPMPVDD